MIIIDYSGVVISEIHASDMASAIEEKLLRHIILNTLKSYIMRFKEEYGTDVIVAADMGSWRKKEFAYYKAKRAKARDKSAIDFDVLFPIMNTVFEEMRDNSPFVTLKINQAEADDIIAVMAKKLSSDGDRTLIVSSDKDFYQLQRYKGVSQFSPYFKKLIVEKNPIEALRTKIISGDSGDGVPNIFSEDDTFVTDGKRQIALTKKRLESIESWSKSEMATIGKILLDEDVTSIDPHIVANWCRNKRMIDFNFIPEDIQRAILEQYETESKKGIPKGTFYEYLVEKRCRKLFEDFDNFF